MSERSGAESEEIETLGARRLRTTPDGKDDAVHRGLREIASWLRVDSARLLERGEDGLDHPLIFVGPAAGVGMAVGEAESPFCARCIRAGRDPFLSSKDELPPEATAETVAWRDDVILRLRLLASLLGHSLARRRSELRLRESGSRARRSEARRRLNTQTLEAAANAISITDLTGRIVWFKAALSRLTGFAAGEIAGQSHRVFDSRQQGAESWTAFWATIRAGRAWMDEVVNRRKDGSTSTQEITVTPVMDETATPTHLRTRASTPLAGER